ncbi:phenylacetate--CoA ligase [soil metagenome]
MIFEPELETMARKDLAKLQDERVRRLARYVHERVPFYRGTFEAAELTPSDIRSVGDLRALPFTTKNDLRDNYPFGLFAVPSEEVVRIHASSGTTGKPTVVGYTAPDIDVFARVNARCLAMAGATPDMMLHNAYGYGLFTGGLGLHYGGERRGMTVVPVSGGMTERQLTLITDFKPQVICCTPSYALTLAQELHERGVPPRAISLRYALLGAEPWTEGMRREVDTRLGVRSTNIYGLSEIIGPGVSNECVEERDGSHVNEDHFFPEVVNPETGEPLDDGEEGVLVFTSLTKRALPLLRYWTGDIASLVREPCSCGRTLARMSLIKGRTDDMLIVRGINLYPTQIEDIIGSIPELSPHYRLVVTRDGTLDDIGVEVEVTDEVFRRAGDRLPSDEKTPEDGELSRLSSSVASTIKSVTGCSVTVTLLAPGTAPRSEGGKLSRVDDRRELS